MLGLRSIGLLAFATAALAAGEVTYSKEISRVFQAKCQQCHRAGDIAPFVLDSYDATLRRASGIQRALATRSMPPWKPKAGYGEFRDSFQLTEDERTMILDWLASGMPEGDPADLPTPLKTDSEWPLGEPDVTVAMTEPYTPPVGADVYRCFAIPTGVAESNYLSAIDVLPGSRQVVHHVIMFQDTEGRAAKLEGKDGAPGYPCFGGPTLTDLNAQLGGWAPGQRTQFLPEGVGIRLEKGASLVIQVHYHPATATSEDRTRVGLYFSKTAVKQRLFIIPITNVRFNIPADADKYEVSASMPVLPFLDAQAIWVYPHMHLLGRDIKIELVNRDRSVTPLIWEDSWDFNWQGSYTFKEQVAIPSGSVVRVRCTYDNSFGNLRNPNYPPVDVGFGEASTDEMCLGVMGLTFNFEKFLPLTSARE